ncbi:MAG: hypothetical protein ACFB51_08945 [Anaerolineae bacterium]
MRPLILTALVVVLAACGPAETPTPVTPSPTPSPTQTAAPLPTATPTATFAPPTRTPTPAAGEVPGFAAVAPLPAVEPIRDGLRVVNGDLWLLAAQAGYRLNADNRFDPLLTDSVAPVIGVEESGRNWASYRDAIGVYEAGGWTVYSADDGWTPIEGGRGAVFRGLTADARGDLWVATPADVRRFDGRTWTIYDLAAMGMLPLTADCCANRFSIAAEPDGDVWVGHCYLEAPGAVSDGGGVRVFDGEMWRGPGAPADRQCVGAVATGPDGVIWLGGDGGGLWWFEEEARFWQSVLTPAAPLSGDPADYGSVSTIIPLGGSEAWAMFPLCTDSGCAVGDARYRAAGGGLTFVDVVATQALRDVVLMPNGTLWIASAAQIQRIGPDGTLVTVAETGSTSDLLVGPAGELWLVTQAADSQWLYQMEEER